MDKYDESISLLKKILPILKKILNEKHPFYIQCSHNLAYSYFKINNFEAARHIYLQLLGKLQKQSSDYARVLNNMGLLYREVMNYDSAEFSWIEVLKIRKEALGEKHIDYILYPKRMAKLEANF